MRVRQRVGRKQALGPAERHDVGERYDLVDSGGVDGTGGIDIDCDTARDALCGAVEEAH